MLKEFAIPEARAGARFYESDFGEMSPYTRHVLEILQGGSSAAANAGDLVRSLLPRLLRVGPKDRVIKY